MSLAQLLVRVDSEGVHVTRDAKSVPHDGPIGYGDPLWQKTLDMFRRWLDRRRFEKPANDDLTVVGTHLFKVLFGGKRVCEVVLNALKDVVAPGKDPDSTLRIVLEFGADELSTRLAALPWEYLYCPPDRDQGIAKGFFIAAHSKLILSRHVSRADILNLAPQENTLRILLVVSRPNFEMVEVPGDKGKLRQPLTTVDASDVVKVLDELANARQGSIEVRRLDDKVNKQDVAKEVEDWHPQVVHFVGHGKFEKGAGHLAMVRQEFSEEAEKLRLAPTDREAAWVKDDAFAECFANYRPRLVFLQACEGARSDAYNAFSGVAQELMAQSVSAVIAMRFPVSNEWAQLFARTFYESLALGCDIDQAVQIGRRRLGTGTDEELNFQSPDFGSPVAFFQRQQDGQEARLSTDAILPNGVRREVAETETPASCPYFDCQRPLVAGRKFCQSCRRSVAPCPSCHKPMTAALGFCDNCGWTAVQAPEANQASAAPTRGVT
jgi:hypothetical protein